MVSKTSLLTITIPDAQYAYILKTSFIWMIFYKSLKFQKKKNVQDLKLIIIFLKVTLKPKHIFEVLDAFGVSNAIIWRTERWLCLNKKVHGYILFTVYLISLEFF